MTSHKLALIGGTSLLKSDLFRSAVPRTVTTSYGTVTLLEQQNLLFLQRHGLEHYTPPHKINHHANLQALSTAGARRILAIGSVGSLRPDLKPGTVLIPDDFYAPEATPTFFDDSRGHRVPQIDPTWRQTLLQTWRASSLPDCVEGGVYWQTKGPRFETPAEIRFHQAHAHVVGMTIASETILAGELNLPYAALCMIDNFANGIGVESLSYDSLKAQVAANASQLIQIIQTLTKALSP